MYMKLVATCKLVLDPEQKSTLVDLMSRFNDACNWLAAKAFEIKSADKYKLQKLHYDEIRSTFGLNAQFTVRCISKVCEAYKRDKTKLPKFKPDGAVPYDQRLYTFKHGLDRVSLATLGKRIVVPTVIGPYHRGKLEGVRGQADLVARKGKLYLYVTVEVPEGAPVDPEEWLGVDLGIRNLATDSDGEHHSGARVEAVRQRYASLRHRLQYANTKSSKRHLKKIAGKEARFRQMENHRISKALVRKAQGTSRGIALEDLHGLRERVTVRKRQRSRHMGWAFHQMRQNITYKALQAGVGAFLEGNFHGDMIMRLPGRGRTASARGLPTRPQTAGSPQGSACASPHPLPPLPTSLPLA
jgi:putative transposase